MGKNEIEGQSRRGLMWGKTCGFSEQLSIDGLLTLIFQVVLCLERFDCSFLWANLRKRLGRKRSSALPISRFGVSNFDTSPFPLTSPSILPNPFGELAKVIPSKSKSKDRKISRVPRILPISSPLPLRHEKEPPQISIPNYLSSYFKLSWRSLKGPASMCSRPLKSIRSFPLVSSLPACPVTSYQMSWVPSLPSLVDMTGRSPKLCKSHRSSFLSSFLNQFPGFLPELSLNFLLFEISVISGSRFQISLSGFLFCASTKPRAILSENSHQELPHLPLAP